MTSLPSPSELLVPMIIAINANGGQLNHKEIEIYVAHSLQIPDSMRNLIRTGTRTELNYRLSWSRTKAKNLGYLEKLGNGNWSLTESGKNYLAQI
jgi:restriction endonuclease Mrr